MTKGFAPHARALTSMSACFSNNMPTTPVTSDEDEWPGPSPPQLRKYPTTQRVQIHPLVINKTALPNASSATALEFALVDPEERTDEDEMSWYARELGQVVSLASPCIPPALVRARAQSCFSRFLRPMYPARARIAEPCDSPRVRRSASPTVRCYHSFHAASCFILN